MYASSCTAADGNSTVLLKLNVTPRMSCSRVSAPGNANSSVDSFYRFAITSSRPLLARTPDQERPHNPGRDGADGRRCVQTLFLDPLSPQQLGTLVSIGCAFGVPQVLKQSPV